MNELCHPCFRDKNVRVPAAHRAGDIPYCERCFHGGNLHAIAACRKTQVVSPASAPADVAPGRTSRPADSEKTMNASESKGRTCACGCGEPPMVGRMYKKGHKPKHGPAVAGGAKSKSRWFARIAA